QVQQDKEAAFDAGDFEAAVALRDREKQLLAGKLWLENQVTAGVADQALLAENQRLPRELQPLPALPPPPGIQPATASPNPTPPARRPARPGPRPRRPPRPPPPAKPPTGRGKPPPGEKSTQPPGPARHSIRSRSGSRS